MPSRKIASNLLWTPEGFVRRPLVTVGGDGRIEEVAVCEEPDRSACTEFYAGILTPALVDAAALAGAGRTQCFRCFVSAEGLAGRNRADLPKCPDTTICIGADPAAPDPLRSMLDTLAAAKDVPLHELLRWATLNGALALGIAQEAGTVETGKHCGLCILSGIDYERMALTPVATIRRIL